MNEFNFYLKNGYAYRKTFPGDSVTDLARYCLVTLQEDKPEACIINIGSNNLRCDQPIVNILNICHNHGVNDVCVFDSIKDW